MSPAPRRTAARRRAAHPLRAPLPSAVAPPSPAPSRPYPGAAGWTPLQGRVGGGGGGARSGEGGCNRTCWLAAPPRSEPPDFCTNSLPSEPSRALPSKAPGARRATCTDSAQEAARSLPREPGARGPLPPRSLQTLFLGCLRGVPTESGCRGSAPSLPRSCSAGAPLRAARSQLVPPSGSSAARGLVAGQRLAGLLARRAGRKREGRRWGCGMDAPERRDGQLVGSRYRAAGRGVARTGALGGLWKRHPHCHAG